MKLKWYIYFNSKEIDENIEITENIDSKFDIKIPEGKEINEETSDQNINNLDLNVSEKQVYKKKPSIFDVKKTKSSSPRINAFDLTLISLKKFKPLLSIDSKVTVSRGTSFFCVGEFKYLENFFMECLESRKMNPVLKTNRVFHIDLIIDWLFFFWRNVHHHF
jgi:hypothetical protein